MSAKKLFFVLFLLVPSWAVAQEEGGSETSVVIVPTKAKGGPNLRSQVKRIEKGLKKEISVVTLRNYQKAGKRVGVKGKAALAQENAQSVGSEAGVTHVVFVEGQMEKEKVGRKTKRINFAAVTLIDVGTGDVTFSERYEIKGRKIPAVTAAEIVTAVLNGMTPPEPPAAVEEIPEEIPPEPPEPPGPAEGEEPIAVSSGEPIDAPPDGSDIEITETGDQPSPMISALTPTLTGDPSISVSETSTRRSKKLRPFISFGVGGLAVSRQAEITQSGETPPAYEGPLPGGYLRVDFFPLAIGGKGKWFEGFGVHGEAQLMMVETDIDPSDAEELVKSNVWGAGGGLSFRLVFWDSATAPDFTLKVGYGAFIFPIKKGAFPGAQYMSPYFGGTFTIPFIEQVALVIGGTVSPLVTTGGKLKRLGAKDSALGFRGEGGVRLFFDPFEFYLVGRFEQFGASYTGEADARIGSAETGGPYSNLSMTDRMFGGWLTGGIAF